MFMLPVWKLMYHAPDEEYWVLDQYQALPVDSGVVPMVFSAALSTLRYLYSIIICTIEPRKYSALLPLIFSLT
jgi:hypothetical protein